jgi:hypothetical protein
VIILEDAETLWNEIYAFIQSKPLPPGDPQTLTQDLFLHLLATQINEPFLQENHALEAILSQRLAVLHKRSAAELPGSGDRQP